MFTSVFRALQTWEFNSACNPSLGLKSLFTSLCQFSPKSQILGQLHSVPGILASPGHWALITSRREFATLICSWGFRTMSSSPLIFNSCKCRGRQQCLRGFLSRSSEVRTWGSQVATGSNANAEGHLHPAPRWRLVLAAGRWQQGQSKSHTQPLGQPELPRAQGRGIWRKHSVARGPMVPTYSRRSERHPCSRDDGDPMRSSYAKDVKSVCWMRVGTNPKAESASRGAVRQEAHLKPEHRAWHTVSA